MAKYFVTRNDACDTIRLDRLWLKIRPSNTVLDIMGPFVTADAHATFIIDSLKAATDTDGYADLFLPLTGEFPTGVFFNNSYGSAAPDLSMSTRAGLQFMGQGLKHTVGGSGILNRKSKGWFSDAKNAIKGEARSGAMTLGNILTQFSGGLTGPSIWEKAEIPNIELTGEVAFESQAECNYYKAVDFLLQLMTTPQIGRGTPIPKLVELVTGAIKKGTPLDTLRVNALIQPMTLCEISIIAGRPIFEAGGMSPSSEVFSEVQTIIDIVPSNELTNTGVKANPQVLLFTVDNCFMSGAKITHGKEGKAFDASGVPRMMEYAFTFVPRDMAALIAGQKKIQEGYKPKELKTIPAFNMTASDGMRAVLYTLLNAGLGIVAKEAQLSRAINAVGVGRHLTAYEARGGDIVPRVQYKAGLADWGTTRMVAELSGIGSAARMVF